MDLKSWLVQVSSRKQALKVPSQLLFRRALATEPVCKLQAWLSSQASRPAGEQQGQGMWADAASVAKQLTGSEDGVDLQMQQQIALIVSGMLLGRHGKLVVLGVFYGQWGTEVPVFDSFPVFSGSSSIPLAGLVLNASCGHR